MEQRWTWSGRSKLSKSPSFWRLNVSTKFQEHTQLMLSKIWRLVAEVGLMQLITKIFHGWEGFVLQRCEQGMAGHLNPTWTPQTYRHIALNEFFASHFEAFQFLDMPNILTPLYLVGGFDLSENISQLGWLFPIYGKNKKMFQTTNQLLYIVG